MRNGVHGWAYDMLWHGQLGCNHPKPLLARWEFVPGGQGASWVATVEDAVLHHLATCEPVSATRLRQEVPEADGYFVQSPTKHGGGKVAIAPRLLTGLNLAGAVARAGNAGAWYMSRPTWTTTAQWWGHQLPEPLDARQGDAELVNRWLWSYVPGTVEDIAWWLGTRKPLFELLYKTSGQSAFH